ncbi:AAA family ATPase [Pseudoalteromonas ruthenica]|uniref:ATPase AAA-type core domain-containing protein n=1 Tax=Pseudoalteromonas ruthenica TaxID=151081 RepID=A0A0F4PFV6_9GAMM|nr:AAA family ATPase [Pseudoalteromonas ruthenica]KJY93923.1 hypothetical protein TW76_18545 [Pseudoalteromonas ruthenica]KJY96413.1 hypothetical protein TW72_16875 [Pseudoalteromonas ruthenica]TMO94600.1 AAA family ATPase [Pseudoalteromonas ruthenica]TMO97241.1 AAA family ATPase [Pseudoalteromonas ruthenica]TMP09195.1 AAA family ATPase [Pseudoalteromonas ruthenica]
MRLLSLRLDGEYKGLRNRLFNFESTTDNVIAFIGLNGSGKSQLLELIAECFAYLERLQRDDFKNKGHLAFDFTLIYSMKGYVNQSPFDKTTVFGQKLRVEEGFTDPIFTVAVNANGKPKIKVEQQGQINNIDIEQLTLPYVVGYSSGLNENLQRPFLKNANQLFKALRARARYHKEKRKLDIGYEQNLNDTELSFNTYQKNKKELLKKYKRNHPYLFTYNTAEYLEDEQELPETTTHLSNFIYLDYDSAQFAVALSDFRFNALFKKSRSKKENLTSLTYTTPTLLQLEFDFTLSHVTDEIVDDVRSFIRIAESTGGAIKYTGVNTTTEEYDYYELDSLKGIISLDLKRLAFESKLSTFGTYDPFRLFERLYKAQQLGMKNVNSHGRKYLEKNGFIGTVKKPLKVRLPLMSKRLMLTGDDLNEVAYEELSDGESQLLQVLAIIKLYTNENTLFLFDEPETHLNPAWRTMFHTYLTKALMGEGKETNSQVFVSTHSPFMVSSLKRSNVFLFSRKGKEEINFQPVQKETYGASFDVLIKDFFELRSLISQSVIDEIREQLEKGDTHAKEWIEDNLGLSAEKAYLIRKLSQ